MTADVVDRLVGLWVEGDAHAIVELCRPDAVVDVNVPQWRYQRHPEALLTTLLENTGMSNRRVTVGYQEPTRDGGVVEVETRGTYRGGDVVIRELWMVRVDGGEITEWVMYCTGPWDAATIARQRTEAPMIVT